MIYKNIKNIYENGRKEYGKMYYIITIKEYADMTKVNLYLDDLRDCPDGFVVARSVEEALNIMKNHDIGILSLDHDMGVNKNGELMKSGYDLVKIICESGDFQIDKIYIHTDNVVGRENMYKTLLSARSRGFISEDMDIYYYPLVPNRWEPIE